MEEEERRAQALERLQARRDFVSHVVSYLAVNLAMIGIWAVTGAGYFWPIWLILPWGIGVVLHAWTVFGQRPITEADIERELHRTDH